jgi:hypothetical protein
MSKAIYLDPLGCFNFQYDNNILEICSSSASRWRAHYKTPDQFGPFSTSVLTSWSERWRKSK